MTDLMQQQTRVFEAIDPLGFGIVIATYLQPPAADLRGHYEIGRHDIALQIGLILVKTDLDLAYLIYVGHDRTRHRAGRKHRHSRDGGDPVSFFHKAPPQNNFGLSGLPKVWGTRDRKSTRLNSSHQ